MKKSFFSIALLFFFTRPIWASKTSSKAHAALDKIYDQIADQSEVDEADLNEAFADSMMVPLGSHSAAPVLPNSFGNLNELLFIHIFQFLDNPIDLGLTCKLFWSIISNFMSFRITDRPLLHNDLQFQISLIPGSELSVRKVLRAFGRGDIKVKADFLVKNLELAFHSPAFRDAFDQYIWSRISRVPVFKERTESILMESNDPFKRRNGFSPEIETHRRILVLILASLPEDVYLVTEFFRQYPVILLNPSSTEACFDKFVVPIAKRLSLLPDDYLINSVLQYFNFDSRLIGELVKIYLKGAKHTSIRSLSNFPLRNEHKINGQIYFGCVLVHEFLNAAEQYLNLFDDVIRDILIDLNTSIPYVLPDFFLSLLELEHPGELSRNEIFHLAVLKSLPNVLYAFEDFDFSYEKDDSEFMNALIERDPNMVRNLLNRFHRMASHKAIVMSSQFQSFHFDTFNKLSTVRVELKRKISSPEITRAHISYIQDYQDRLFNLLLADSSDRISSYFKMEMKGHERKRYKEHPSFTIALTTLDIFFESRLVRFTRRSEHFDPELVLKQMLFDLCLVPLKPEEYFELAHDLASFVKAQRVGEEDSLLVPEAASTQDDTEFQLLSQTISLDRVINDGKTLNYRLVLRWFEYFGFGVSRIIPINELKALLKGAAFHTIRSLEDKKLRFDLDAQFQNDPFSMTYRYAVIIITTQCKGVAAAVTKRLKSLFPGVLADDIQNEANRQLLTQLVTQACDFYRLHATDFFSKFKFVATNSRAERFLIDFIRHFIDISGLKHEHPSLIAREFFRFINFDPDQEDLLKDHFMYFILLASFRKRN